MAENEIGKGVISVAYDTAAAMSGAESLGTGLLGKFTGLGGQLSGQLTSGVAGTGEKMLQSIGPGVLTVGIPAAVAAATVGVGAALYGLGSQFDTVFDKLQVDTGLSGQALEGLKESFRNVAGSTPADFATVETALAGVTNKLGLSGQNAETLALQFTELARITGGDVTKQVSGAAELFNRWGVATEDQSKKLDGLFVASQKTGVPIENLMDLTTKFAPALRNAGFGLDQSAALLATFEKAGVNSQKAMMGLNTASVQWAKEGVTDIPGALNNVISSIQGATSEQEAFAIATQTFGARAGGEWVQAIRSGSVNIQELTGQIAGASGTITDTAASTDDAGEKFSKLKNRLKVAFEPLASNVFDGLNTALGWVSEKLVVFMDWLEVNWPPFWDAVKAKIDQVWPPIQETISSVFNSVQSIFNSVLPVLQGIWNLWGDNLLSYLKTTWEVFSGVISGALQVIRGIFSFFAAIFRGDWEGAWNALKDIAGGIWNAIFAVLKGVWDTIVNVAKATWDLLKLGLSTAWNSLKDQALDIWNGIKDGLAAIWNGIKDAASGVWDGVVSTFKTAINTLIRLWNGLSFSVPDIPGTDWGGFTITVPQIPELHQGGVFVAAGGADEGLALLRSGEVVLTAEQARNGSGATYTMNVYPRQADAADLQAAFGLMEALEAVG